PTLYTTTPAFLGQVCMPTGTKHKRDGCESPCGCWELNSGPLEEQSVLLTAQPSLQPQAMFFHCPHLCVWRAYRVASVWRSEASSLLPPRGPQG
ncbi:mCG144592, partial [Mus musculus]